MSGKALNILGDPPTWRIIEYLRECFYECLVSDRYIKSYKHSHTLFLAVLARVKALNNSPRRGPGKIVDHVGGCYDFAS